MVKHTQTIRWQIADELFGVCDHFVGLVLKGLNPKKAAPQNEESVKNSREMRMLDCINFIKNVSPKL